MNEAYNCLKKPILRANYLLTLNGRALEENENIRLGNLYHETCFLFCEPGYLNLSPPYCNSAIFHIFLSIADGNFLAEIVELNEEILVAESRTDVAGLAKNVRDTLQEYYNAVEIAFDESKDIEEARRITSHMQYYENLKRQLVKRETELGIVH